MSKPIIWMWECYDPACSVKTETVEGKIPDHECACGSRQWLKTGQRKADELPPMQMVI